MSRTHLKGTPPTRGLGGLVPTCVLVVYGLATAAVLGSASAAHSPQPQRPAAASTVQATPHRTPDCAWRVQFDHIKGDSTQQYEYLFLGNGLIVQDPLDDQVGLGHWKRLPGGRLQIQWASPYVEVLEIDLSERPPRMQIVKHTDGAQVGAVRNPRVIPLPRNVTPILTASEQALLAYPRYVAQLKAIAGKHPSSMSLQDMVAAIDAAPSPLTKRDLLAIVMNSPVPHDPDIHPFAISGVVGEIVRIVDGVRSREADLNGTQLEWEGYLQQRDPVRGITMIREDTTLLRAELAKVVEDSQNQDGRLTSTKRSGDLDQPLMRIGEFALPQSHDQVFVIGSAANGHAEIGVIASGELFVLRDDGSLTFRDRWSGKFLTGIQALSSAPRYVVVEDLDHDGDSDILFYDSAAGGVLRLVNERERGFTKARMLEQPEGIKVLGLAVVDHDDDEYLDLAVLTTIGGEIRLGAAHPPYPGPTEVKDMGIWVPTNLGMTSSDLNRDKEPDLIIPKPPGSIVVALSPVGTRRPPTREYKAGLSHGPIACADLNGDFYPDLAQANFYSGDVSVLINDGTGAFRAAVSWPATERCVGLTTGDIDGDGDQDLVVGGDLCVLLNDGKGNFSAPNRVPTAERPTDVLVADLDGDGADEIIAVQRDRAVVFSAARTGKPRP